MIVCFGAFDKPFARDGIRAEFALWITRYGTTLDQ
jgi:hypothetical protein